jgi:ribosomal protein L14
MVRVIDNSGASWVKCFNVLRKKRTVGRIGDIMVGSVREVRELEENKSNSKVTRVTKGSPDSV